MRKIRFSHKTSAGNERHKFTYSLLYHATSDEVLESLLNARQHQEEYSEEITEILKEITLARNEYVLRSIPAQLTNTQKAVFDLLFTKNQTQIAQELGIAQSTVHRIIYGVPLYSKEDKPKVKYGGLIKKMQKWAIKDAVLLELSNIELAVKEEEITPQNAYKRLALLGLT